MGWVPPSKAFVGNDGNEGRGRRNAIGDSYMRDLSQVILPANRNRTERTDGEQATLLEFPAEDLRGREDGVPDGAKGRGVRQIEIL